MSEVKKKNPKRRYITDGIAKSGYFSVNIPSTSLIREMDFCGMVSGKETDKSSIFNAFFDDAGSAPMIDECPLSFLCKVCDAKSIRGFTMFFGEILAAYMNEKRIIDDKPDSIKLDPIIMMGMSYCS